MTRGVLPFAHGHALAAAASPVAVAGQPTLAPVAQGTGRWTLPPRRFGAGLTLVIASLMLLTGGVSGAQAAPAPAAPTAAPAAKSPCVMVDIAGQTAGTLDCANQALADAAARGQAAARPHVDIPTIGSSPTALGQANVAATRERLGSSFGVSVDPQRPPAATYAPPLGRPPR